MYKTHTILFDNLFLDKDKFYLDPSTPELIKEYKNDIKQYEFIFHCYQKIYEKIIINPEISIQKSIHLDSSYKIYPDDELEFIAYVKNGGNAIQYVKVNKRSWSEWYTDYLGISHLLLPLHNGFQNANLGTHIDIHAILEKDHNNNLYARVFQYQIFIINHSKINQLRSKYYFNIKNEIETTEIINESNIPYYLVQINHLYETYVTYQQLFNLK
jgi:hypothetical protein